MSTTADEASQLQLRAETIVIRIRWFGLLLGAVYVNLELPPEGRLYLDALLAVGAAYTVLDTIDSLRGKAFLSEYPLFIGGMEAIFIGLLCSRDGGLDSPFRYYYLLSLICCAIRYTKTVTYLTCVLHMTSAGVLQFAVPNQGREPFVLTLAILGWMTWAASALAELLKATGARLAKTNAALQENQALLEARIVERTRELQETQAQVLHQEKMANFGLLAAGIAHEVGNPLTAMSTVLQLLERRDHDPYTKERLGLVGGQLQRIQTTLRELVNISRPASNERTRFALKDAVEEALGIAKYYRGVKSRKITTTIADHLPALVGVRDQLVQAVLNLVLNAIDATQKGGHIAVSVAARENAVEVAVADDGPGIGPGAAPKLFAPYFTTKPHGTGLGLFVTRKLVASHGGTVEFDSMPGQGATFRIRLPYPAEDAATR